MSMTIIVADERVEAERISIVDDSLGLLRIVRWWADRYEKIVSKDASSDEIVFLDMEIYSTIDGITLSNNNFGWGMQEGYSWGRWGDKHADIPWDSYAAGYELGWWLGRRMRGDN